MNKLLMITVALTAATAVHAQQLNVEQANKLVEVGQGFSQQARVFESLLQNKLTELAIELQRDGRLDDEKSAAKASAAVNSIMTDMGNLYGEYIKTKVQFVLKAKNVLTDEQKIFMLSQLTPNESYAYEEIDFLQPEIFELPLNLSVEQEKKLVIIEADLLIKEIGLERDVELVLLDLQPLLLSGMPQPNKVDPLVMKLGDLAAQAINNRVNCFLLSKDVLTLDQKRLLGNLMGLN